jgi:hypothetical protein
MANLIDNNNHQTIGENTSRLDKTSTVMNSVLTATGQKKITMMHPGFYHFN